MPDILYHGTSREFHDEQIERMGKYIVRDPLERRSSIALSRAYKKTSNEGNPAILIINSSKIENLNEETLTCPYLDPEWYEILDIGLEDRKISMETIHKLSEIEEKIIGGI